METLCGVTKITTRLWLSCKFFKTRQQRSCLICHQEGKALDRLDLKTLLKRRHFHRCVMMQKYLSGEIDFNLYIRRNNSFHYLTRRSNGLHLPHLRTNWGKQTFIYQASKDCVVSRMFILILGDMQRASMWSRDVKRINMLSL